MLTKMKIFYPRLRICKTRELNGSNYDKIPLRSNAILNIQNNDKYCFLWSILAFLHPCENSHPSRVRSKIQHYDEIKFEGFDFTDGFKCSDVQRFERRNNLSINIFDLNFYQDQDKWKHNLIPIEISKYDESDRVVDLIIYKNNYALFKI